MKYLCVLDYGNLGIGDTLEAAFENMLEVGDVAAMASDCEFYELISPVKVEVKLIPIVKTKISPKLPK